MRLSECRKEDVSRLQHGATLRDAELSTFPGCSIHEAFEGRIEDVSILQH
jgi:hypothetical protein